MSDPAKAAALIHAVVSVDAASTIGERIMLTARRLGWPYSRTRDVWHEQARRIDAWEMDQLRAATIKQQIEEVRHDYAALRSKLARITAALDALDSAADSEGPDLFGGGLRGHGDAHRAGNGRGAA